MDSGYIGPGETHAQALEDDYDVRRELQAKEVLGLMDQLLCHEVRNGHSRGRWSTVGRKMADRPCF